MRLLFVLAIVMSAACVAQDSAAPGGDTMPAQTIAEPQIINCGVFAANDPKLDPISKLCGFALTYRTKLPDFIARQTTTSRGPRSTVVITAQVTYRKGVEQHSEVAINGKPVPPKGPVYADLHFFTNGEFGPMLINLFEVPGAIEFTFVKDATLLGEPVAVFDFHLPKSKNTFWTIHDPRGETLNPEFRGHLWLEKQTGRIKREELEAIVDAWQTGITSMKLSADFSMTKVSDVGTFLLPAKSESTVCMIGRLGAQAGCVNNATTFHDYQKFVATSRVVPAEPAP